MKNERTGINYYESTRCELFEVLLPKIIYEEADDSGELFNLIKV